MSSGFPVLIGAVLGNRRIFRKMYAALPALMVVELIAGSAAALVASLDLAVYYVFSMIIIGVFSTSIVYLLQKIKEQRYHANRAAFDGATRWRMHWAPGRRHGEHCRHIRAPRPRPRCPRGSAPEHRCVRALPRPVPSDPRAEGTQGRRGASPMHRSFASEHRAPGSLRESPAGT